MILQTDSLHPQLRRAMMYLEDEMWEKAHGACERVLDMEPENPSAYVIELMAQLHIRSEEELRSYHEPIRDHGLFCKALHFAKEAQANALTECADAIEARLEQERREAEDAVRRSCYSRALQLMKSDASEEELAEAKGLLERVAKYQDVDEEWNACRVRLEKLQRENKIRTEAARKKQTRIGLIVAAGLAVMLTVMCMMISSGNAKRAVEIERNLPGLVFEGEVNEFGKTSDFLVMEREVTRYTYVFTNGDTVAATIEHCEDRDGSVLIIDGREVWDSHQMSEATYEVGDIQISLFGKVTVKIGNKLFEVTVGPDDVPSKLVCGNLTLTR